MASLVYDLRYQGTDNIGQVTYTYDDPDPDGKITLTVPQDELMAEFGSYGSEHDPIRIVIRMPNTEGHHHD